MHASSSSSSSSARTREEDIEMVETKVETIKFNAVTFWACTYELVTVEAVIKEWEDSFRLSLHSSRKILKQRKPNTHLPMTPLSSLCKPEP
jgi:hypothetical protein